MKRGYDYSVWKASLINLLIIDGLIYNNLIA